MTWRSWYRSYVLYLQILHAFTAHGVHGDRSKKQLRSLVFCFVFSPSSSSWFKIKGWLSSSRGLCLWSFLSIWGSNNYRGWLANLLSWKKTIPEWMYSLSFWSRPTSKGPCTVSWSRGDNLHTSCIRICWKGHIGWVRLLNYNCLPTTIFMIWSLIVFLHPWLCSLLLLLLLIYLFYNYMILSNSQAQQPNNDH